MIAAVTGAVCSVRHKADQELPAGVGRAPLHRSATGGRHLR